MTLRLAEHGDGVEQIHWDRFLRDEFPSYETVWAEYVAPLTLMPEAAAFKSDEGLAKIGRGPADVANAQLHYTTFTHLVRVYALRQDRSYSPDTFTEAVVRLAAATDVADELLERMTNRGKYEPWEESSKARRSWREAHGYPMQSLRDYRNRLLHGGLVPFEIFRRMARIDEQGVETPAEEGLRFPKIGREADYLDWRRLIGPEREKSLPLSKQDLDSADNIVGEAWGETLAYFEREWQTNLVPLRQATRAGGGG